VNELKECLRKLRGLGQHGGDIFFAGLARTMVAKPVIPQSFRVDKSAGHFVPESDKPASNKQMRSKLRQETERLKAMTKTQISAAGGVGIVRDSPPSKAYRAAVAMQKYGQNPFQMEATVPEFPSKMTVGDSVD